MPGMGLNPSPGSKAPRSGFRPIYSRKETVWTDTLHDTIGCIRKLARHGLHLERSRVLEANVGKAHQLQVDHTLKSAIHQSH